MAWDRAWFDGTILHRRMNVWRAVEAQHVVATMRLVDSFAEQELLEQLIETSKPVMPQTQLPQHYLLTTPFRYSPVHPSRFRRAHTKGQWYGAETVYAVCAEVAYWRHRFILDSVGLLEQEILTEHTMFQAVVEGQSIDLMAAPWKQARACWTHGHDYSATHALAIEAQERAVQWLAYESVRAPGQRCAVVWDPNALSEPATGLHQTMQTWHCKATRTKVMFVLGRERFEWDF